MDHYDLECASQEEIHTEIKNRLFELNELMDYSETYHSYAFEEELSRIELLDNLNNILIENDVPERFKILSGDVDGGNFLGVRVSSLTYLDDRRLSDKEYKLLKNITKKALPYLKFIDEVLNNAGKNLIISGMFTEYSHSTNDINHIKFNITNDGVGLVCTEVTLKKTSSNNFKILYLKIAHHFSDKLDLMDYEDSFIAGPNISGGKYVGVDEKPITVKESSELSQMISEGIDCLYNTFNELAERYKNMSK